MTTRNVALWAGTVLTAGVAMAVLAGGEGDAPAHAISQTAAAAHATAPDPFNGAAQYLPALAALLFFSLITWRRQHPLRAWVRAVAVTFPVSRAIRSVDFRVCDTLPRGLHVIWPTLNGLLAAVRLRLPVRAISSREATA